MQDILETLALVFSLFLIFSTISTFILLMRYIAYKEKQALNNLPTQKENSHE